MEPSEPAVPPLPRSLATFRERLGTMIAFDRREVVALALLAVLVVTGATVAYARARPADASALQPVTTPPGGVAQPGAPAGARLIVHVVGAVNDPGVYDFDEGARVVEAVRAAGGFSRKADRAAINLARPLIDGEQLVVPRLGDAAAPGGGVAAPGGGDVSGKVSINAATATELEALPGIGPVLAQRIVDYRDQHGPFRTVGDLQKVSGIGAKTFASLEPHISI